MRVGLASVLQLALMIGTFAYGYGSLDRRVVENAKDIADANQELVKRDEDFIEKFDMFLLEQRAINNQIVELTTNQSHVMRKLELD